MVDPTPAWNLPAATLSACPWCSSPLAAAAEVCPTCGANLIADEAREVPGLTAVDEAVASRLRVPPTTSRNRLMAWLSGEYRDDSQTPLDVQAVAPPDDDVRREILRLELEARVADLQAEADAMLAEAAEAGRTLEIPDALRRYAPAELVEAVDPAPAGTPGAADEAPPQPPDVEAPIEP